MAVAQIARQYFQEIGLAQCFLFHRLMELAGEIDLTPDRFEDKENIDGEHIFRPGQFDPGTDGLAPAGRGRRRLASRDITLALAIGDPRRMSSRSAI